MRENIIRATMPEMAPYEEYAREIRDIWDTGLMTNNGPKARAFALGLRAYTKNPNVEVFVNGHAALVTAIKALEIREGAEVLTSPFTFASTTNAIVQCGLIPVFCDIDDSYGIDPESVRRNITPRTAAIITPHIFGIPCRVGEIGEIAAEHGLKVIYDGAQAFGTKIDGKSIALFGDATMFSFHAIKVFNSIEGGAVSYRDPALKRKFELYRNFGIAYDADNDVEVSGYNAKMTEFSAAMGLVNLPRLDDNIARRKHLAARYAEALEGVRGIRTYPYEPQIDYNYAYFPIIIDEEKAGKSRDEVWSLLLEDGIETRKLYDRLACDFAAYKGRGYRSDVPHAREMAKKCLDLPMYTKLRDEDVEIIANAIKKIVKS